MLSVCLKWIVKEIKNIKCNFFSEKIEEKLKSLALKITDYQSNMLKKKSLVNGGAIESKKLLVI